VGTGIKVVDRQTNKLITKKGWWTVSRRLEGKKETTQTNVIESKTSLQVLCYHYETKYRRGQVMWKMILPLKG